MYLSFSLLASIVFWVSFFIWFTTLVDRSREYLASSTSIGSQGSIPHSCTLVVGVALDVLGGVIDKPIQRRVACVVT